MQGCAQVKTCRHNCPSLPPKKKNCGKKPNPNKGNQPQQQWQLQQQQSYSRNANQCTRCGDSQHAQGFNCPAKKYQCKTCNKIGHFTKMCFTKNLQPQSQQQHKAKPKQAYQIIIPERADESDDDDSSIIAYQIHTQPQKTVNSQKPSKVTQRNACMLTFHIGYNHITNTTSIYMYNLTLVLMST